MGLQATRALVRAGAEDHRLAAPAVALEDELARLAVGAAAAIRAAGVLLVPRLAVGDELGAAGNRADVQERNGLEVRVAWGIAEHATRRGRGPRAPCLGGPCPNGPIEGGGPGHSGAGREGVGWAAWHPRVLGSPRAVRAGRAPAATAPLGLAARGGVYRV